MSQPTVQTQTLGVTSRIKCHRNTAIDSYKNIHEYTQYNKYTSVFRSPVNRRYRSTASDTEAAQETTTRGVRKTSDAMFARQPAVEGLGDEGPGQRSRWIAGPTRVTRTSDGFGHFQADDDDEESSAAGRDLGRGNRRSVHRREREKVHQRLTHSTVGWQIADIDYDLVLLFTCNEQLHD